jgi:hypothetical protein
MLRTAEQREERQRKMKAGRVQAQADALSVEEEALEDLKFGNRRGIMSHRGYREGEFHLGVYAPNFMQELAHACRLASGLQHQKLPHGNVEG